MKKIEVLAAQLYYCAAFVSVKTHQKEGRKGRRGFDPPHTPSLNLFFLSWTERTLWFSFEKTKETTLKNGIQVSLQYAYTNKKRKEKFGPSLCLFLFSSSLFWCTFDTFSKPSA